MASDNRDKERKMRLQPAGDAAFVILDRPTFGRRPSFQMNNIPIQITNIRRLIIALRAQFKQSYLSANISLCRLNFK